MIHEIFGFFGGLLVLIAFFPQFWQMWKTKAVRDVSMPTYVILFVATCLWTTHGIINADLAVIIANVGLLPMHGLIIYTKWSYGRIRNSE